MAVTPEEERAQKQKQKSNTCTVLVELLQKNRRRKDRVHFLYAASTSPRGVWRKLRLDLGPYIIVASTYRPNQSGHFFVRIFSKTGNTLGQDSSFMASERRSAWLQSRRDDKVNAKELMELFNSGSPR
ncbi:unnamed protein product [Tetraodon nigroviridis]|uniref:(spotted green pufferfish) hypothetical protein n=1 Tax=Tetraodon nigroviridis TaxID=99883 RepID=Q4SPK2_TETNG|nr:unnamed protein product [Tetraodon nigroviridis]